MALAHRPSRRQSQTDRLGRWLVGVADSEIRIDSATSETTVIALMIAKRARPPAELRLQ